MAAALPPDLRLKPELLSKLTVDAAELGQMIDYKEFGKDLGVQIVGDASALRLSEAPEKAPMPMVDAAIHSSETPDWLSDDEKQIAEAYGSDFNHSLELAGREFYLIQTGEYPPDGDLEERLMRPTLSSLLLVKTRSGSGVLLATGENTNVVALGHPEGFPDLLYAVVASADDITLYRWEALGREVVGATIKLGALTAVSDDIAVDNTVKDMEGDLSGALKFISGPDSQKWELPSGPKRWLRNNVSNRVHDIDQAYEGGPMASYFEHAAVGFEANLTGRVSVSVVVDNDMGDPGDMDMFVWRLKDDGGEDRKSVV